MLLSLNILKKLVNIDDIDPEEISRQLTMSTAETEGVIYLNSHFETVVTAKLLSVEKHPDSDHLTVVKADTGKDVFDVVCGAPNHKAGDIAPLALVGTKFSEDFVIKEAVIRGQKSCGMLCSEKELGLSDDGSGILIFDKNTETGVPLSKLYPEWVDVQIEIDNKSITHRPDLWGHYGFARELAAIFKRELKDPVDMSLAESFSSKDNLDVSIECPDNGLRYCGLVVKGITIGQSPQWLKSAVTSIGMRPVNNIVDITNYVMAEIGEPMHAFSRKKLKGNSIIVRMAREGETLMTLDGQKRKLTPDDIVIADTDNPIAIAGVMGGGNSEIDDETTEIVLEAACFDAVHIRRTAHRLNLRTDAATRFEKSLDPELCDRAIIRCYQLIRELMPNAEAVTQIVDAYPKKHKKLHINISCSYIRERLGQDIPDNRIVEILTALEYEVTREDGLLSIEVPTYRATKDIEIAADIVEEIGRIFGYDNISEEAPLVQCTTPEHNVLRELERRIKQILSRDCSLIEVYNYSFVGEQLLQKAGMETVSQLRLRNPLSVEHDRLRTSLVPELLDNIHLNAKHTDACAFYELGRIYLKDNRQSQELAEEKFIAAGAFYTKDTTALPFYDAKHTVSILLEKLKIKNYSFEIPEKPAPHIHPGRSVQLTIDGKAAGLVYEVNPVIQKNFDYSGRSALFEISVEALLNAEKISNTFRGIRKFPDVHFEMSILCPENTYAEKLLHIVRDTSEYILHAGIISVYTGDPIPRGMKSVSIRITYNGNDHTLSSEETVSLQNKALEAIKQNGLELR